MKDGIKFCKPFQPLYGYTILTLFSLTCYDCPLPQTISAWNCSCYPVPGLWFPSSKRSMERKTDATSFSLSHDALFLLEVSIIFMCLKCDYTKLLLSLAFSPCCLSCFSFVPHSSFLGGCFFLFLSLSLSLSLWQPDVGVSIAPDLEVLTYLINTKWPCHCVSGSHSQLKFAVNTMDSVLSSLYPLNIILANLLRLSPSPNNLYMKLFMLSCTWSLIAFFEKIYGKNDWCYVFQFVQFVTQIFLLKFSISLCV